jgi:hypothetical protein
MLKPLVEWISGFLYLAKETRDNSRDIHKLREEFDLLARRVEELAVEIQYVSEREKLEREKLVLQLENALLRMERALPQNPSRKKKR